MAATLIKGAPPKRPRAHRQVRDAETGRWRTATRGDKRATTDRWRTQASVQLWTDEVPKRDATAKTAAAAEDALVERLQALLAESSPERPRTDLTVADVARLWLAAPERHDVATSSLGVYESSCRRWLLLEPLPDLGKLRFRQLELRDVSAWLLAIASASGIPTARTARSVLSNIVRYGMRRATR